MERADPIIEGSWLSGQVTDGRYRLKVRELRDVLQGWSESKVHTVWKEIDVVLTDYVQDRYGKRSRHDRRLGLTIDIPQEQLPRLGSDDRGDATLIVSLGIKGVPSVVSLTNKYGISVLAAVTGLHDAAVGKPLGLQAAWDTLQYALRGQLRRGAERAKFFLQGGARKKGKEYEPKLTIRRICEHLGAYSLEALLDFLETSKGQDYVEDQFSLRSNPTGIHSIEVERDSERITYNKKDKAESDEVSFGRLKNILREIEKTPRTE